MGDPECQTILPLIDNDLVEIIDACCNSNLEHYEIKWKNKKSMCIVLCSKGYPEKYNKNIEIKNLNESDLPKSIIFSMLEQKVLEIKF